MGANTLQDGVFCSIPEVTKRYHISRWIAKRLATECNALYKLGNRYHIDQATFDAYVANCLCDVEKAENQAGKKESYEALGA